MAAVTYKSSAGCRHLEGEKEGFTWVRPSINILARGGRRPKEDESCRPESSRKA